MRESWRRCSAQALSRAQPRPSRPRLRFAYRPPASPSASPLASTTEARALSHLPTRLRPRAPRARARLEREPGKDELQSRRRWRWRWPQPAVCITLRRLRTAEVVTCPPRARAPLLPGSYPSSKACFSTGGQTQVDACRSSRVPCRRASAPIASAKPPHGSPPWTWAGPPARRGSLLGSSDSRRRARQSRTDGKAPNLRPEDFEALGRPSANGRPKQTYQRGSRRLTRSGDGDERA